MRADHRGHRAAGPLTARAGPRGGRVRRRHRRRRRRAPGAVAPAAHRGGHGRRPRRHPPRARPTSRGARLAARRPRLAVRRGRRRRPRRGPPQRRSAGGGVGARDRRHDVRHHRPGEATTALGHPRIRRRHRHAHGRRFGGLAGLGGRRRPSGTARFLPALVPRAPRVVRAARHPVRALRRGLRARAHRLRPAHRRRRRDVPALPHRRRRSRGGPRRVAVGRTRRRAGPRGVAAAHVLARDAAPVRSVQGDLGPGRPAEPRQPRPPPPPRRRPALLRAHETAAADPALPARRRQPRHRGPALRRRRQVRRHEHRGDVPELHGDQARGALHARSRAAAVRDVARRDDHRRLGLHRGPRRPRPVPGVQGVSLRLPRRRRHGLLQGGVPAPPLRGQGAPREPLLPGFPAAVGPAGLPASRPRQRGTAVPHRRRVGEAPRRHRGRARTPDVRPHHAAQGVAAQTPSWWRPPSGGAVAGHVHRPLRTGDRRGGHAGAGTRRVRRRPPPLLGLLWPDVDLHRPARHRPARPASQPGRAARRHRGGHADRRSRTELPGRAAPRRARAPRHTARARIDTRRVPRTPRARCGVRLARRPRADPAALSPARGARARRRRTPAAQSRCRQPHTRLRMLRAGGQLRGRARALRHLRGGREPRARPRGRGRGPRRARAGRRVQLPHPDH